jgi:hypothetical protein
MTKPRANAPLRPSGAPKHDPSNPVSRTPDAPGSTPGSDADDHLELPHERDQSTTSTASAPDPDMRQAHQDLKDYVAGAGGQPTSQKAPPPSPTAPRKDPRR